MTWSTWRDGAGSSPMADQVRAVESELEKLVWDLRLSRAVRLARWRLAELDRTLTPAERAAHISFVQRHTDIPSE